MAQWNSTATLALVAILAIFAGNLILVMGQYDDSYSIQNNLGIQIIVHCFNTDKPDDRGEVMVNPGTGYSYAFNPLLQNEAYECTFSNELPAGQGSQKQDFVVWQTNDGSSNPLNIIDHSHWNVEADGFYLQEPPSDDYFKLYSWVESR